MTGSRLFYRMRRFADARLVARRGGPFPAAQLLPPRCLGSRFLIDLPIEFLLLAYLLRRQSVQERLRSGDKPLRYRLLTRFERFDLFPNREEGRKFHLFSPASQILLS